MLKQKILTLVPLVLGVTLVLTGVGMVGNTVQDNFVPEPGIEEASTAVTVDLREKWAAADIQDIGLSKEVGEGFALMYIPTLGKDWRSVVVSGTKADDLLGMVGHFPRSSDPGMVGNFALAAHRLTKGSLFRNLDKVKKGDKIYVETQDRWFTYTVTGKKVISPRDADVVEPVPFKLGAKPEKALITLTTCHPWYSSTQRLAVFGELTETRLKPMGPPEGVPLEALEV